MLSYSFDGTMSMISDDVGIQARLREINEDLVYIWCYAVRNAHKLHFFLVF